MKELNANDWHVGLYPAPKNKILDVFATGEPNTKWQKIGVGFVNRDGSLNIILDAIPLTGKLHIRERAQPEILK